MKRSGATVRDVAQAARVSTATVSRALNDDGRVSEEARARVREAAERLNYRANHVARSLKTRSTRTVAILAPELSNDFFMELAEGMERELAKSGYMLLISSSSNSAAEEERRLRILADRLVDGIVVIPAASRGEHLQAAADRGTPVVLVDRLVEGASLDAVLADNEGGACEAVRALIAEGFQRVAFVGGDISLTTARERLAGFGRALAGAGLPSGSDSVRLGGMGIEDGWRLMDAILSEPDPPEALFAVNLLVHLGMERRLLSAGPLAFSRFAVAGFDETPYSPFMGACRYTVSQPAAEMGAAAAALVLERIARAAGTSSVARGGARDGEGNRAPPVPPAPRTVRLPTTLIRHPRG